VETDTYQIKTAGFEGPFGLLLNLIEKRKLFINDISLAQVTEDYLSYMNKLGGLCPAEISSFVLIASTLLLIKSKSLLPGLNLTPEEEGDMRNLEERLRLYELFTKLSGNIKNNFGRRMIFAPLERKPARLNSRSGGNDVLVFLPDDQISKNSMMAFARDLLDAMPKKTLAPEVEVRQVISIEEMIEKLTQRIKSSLKMNFKDFSAGGGPASGWNTGEKKMSREEKIIVIVGFLAMLELIRQGLIDALQENNSGDIIIQKTKI
jgi:segregation and condensation protein A